MVSLGVNSADWNRLDAEEIYDLIYEKVGKEQVDYKDLNSENDIQLSNEAPILNQTSNQNHDDDYRTDSEEGHKAHSYEEASIFREPSKRVIKIDPSSLRSEEDKSGYSYKEYLSKKTKPRKKWIKPGMIFALVMVVSIAFALRAQYRDKGTLINPAAEDNSIQLSPTDALDTLTETAKKYPVYEFENCLYYDSIGDREKEIYQIFYDLVIHKDDKEYVRELMLPLYEFEELKDDIDLVFYAMLRDHPELFYISVSETRLPSMEGYTDNVAAVIKFQLGPADRNEAEMIAKFDSAVNSFMRGIDKTKSDAEIELQIHDKLNDMVTYDKELIEIGLEGPDLAHTAYGALVDNGRGTRHRAVCDGYAQAFQYLLGKAGICAAQVTGDADKPGGTLWGDAYHAWNIVRLDDEWYEVDCCWDDLELEELQDFYLEKEIKKVEDKYFYVTHHWFNRTTEEMRNLPASERTRFFIPGYESFNFIEETTHVREIRTDEEWYRSFEYLNGYLPEATGTKYKLE